MFILSVFLILLHDRLEGYGSNDDLVKFVCFPLRVETNHFPFSSPYDLFNWNPLLIIFFLANDFL